MPVRSLDVGEGPVLVEARDLLGFIRDIPLFRMHSEQERGDVLRSAELRRYRSGELVFEQGDPGDRFYVVYSGRVRILIRGGGEERKEVNLGVIAAGGHFGETALITGEPRNAAARAVEDSVLLALDRESFHRVLLATQEQRDTFERFIRSTSIHRFLGSCTDLASVPAQELKQLVLAFQPGSFKAGETVFRQGEAGDRFYLVERGKAKVVRTEGGEQRVLAFLHQGDFFGEKALIEERPRHADVVCLTDLQVYSLSHEAFDSLLRGTPRLRKVIEDRIRSYSSEAAPPIAYQERVKQEMAGDRSMQVEEQPAEVGPAAAKPDGPHPSWRRRLRFPFIEQYDEMTCGTTCLMMIARYYGKEFSSARLRDLASVDQTGASLANLQFAAEQVGFATRALRLTYESLRSVHHPCIIHWRGYHYVVVYKVDARHAWIADPGLGLRKLSREEVCQNWHGIAMVLEPGPALARQKDERASLRGFLSYVKPYRAILAEIFLASVLLNLLGLASPVFTQVVVDNVLGRDNPSVLNMMLVGMLLVLLFRVLVSGARAYLIAHTSLRMDLRMLSVFYRHMLALPLGYYKVRRIGDFISRFTDNSKIREFLANTALSLVLDSVMIAVCLGLMFWYSAQMTLLALLLVPAVVIITAVFTPLLRRLNIDSLAAGAESGSELIESIAGIDTVKAMGLEHRSRRRWEDKFTKALNLELRLSRTTIVYEGLGELVGTLAPTLLLWVGAYKVMQGALTSAS
jgi:ATP-binding cassette subfamily B protein